MEIRVIRTERVLGTLAAALLVSGCRPAQEIPPASLVGAWRSSLQFDSGGFAGIKDLEFMYVFNEGGTLTESSNYDGAPPVPPAYGVWRSVGPWEFEAKYEYYATAPSPPEVFRSGGGWLPSGRGIFTERITLSPDGQSFTSTIRYEALGVKGEPVAGSGEAKGRAVRIAF
jgi:hypothetical protein